jgi:hypothetical protein
MKNKEKRIDWQIIISTGLVKFKKLKNSKTKRTKSHKFLINFTAS